MIWDGLQPPTLLTVPPILRWDGLAETATLRAMDEPPPDPFALAEPERPTVSSRIREERERRNWTQEKLAAMVGVTEQTISRYERTRPPKMPMLTQIAAAFGMRVHDLIPQDVAAEPEEKALVEWYRHAPDDDRQRVLRLARTLYEARLNETAPATFTHRPADRR